MASIGDSRTGMRNQSSIADLIVKGAIALVTAAFFIGAYLQFQVTFWLALIAALSVYITLLMLHALMRRSERVDALVSEVGRLEGEVARLQGQDAYAPPPARGPQDRAAAATKPALLKPASLKASPLTPLRKPPAPPPAGPPQAGGRFEPKLPAPPPRGHQPPARSPTGGPPPPKMPPQGAPYASPPAGNAGPQLEQWTAKAAGAEPMHDYWSFRPAKQAPPEGSKPRRGEAPPAGGEREADLEAVQGMIKRLADELSIGGDAATEAGRPSQETAIRASVDALHSTADTMRAAATKAAPLRSRGPLPPPIAPGHTRLSAVAAAVAAGRVDVMLDPIVGLADHQVHYYEMILCPLDERGTILPLAAHDPQLARTGVNPLVDTARLTRGDQVLRSLAGSGQKTCVFASISAESLATDRFLDELANAYRLARIAGFRTRADVRASRREGVRRHGMERAHGYARSRFPLRPGACERR